MAREIIKRIGIVEIMGIALSTHKFQTLCQNDEPYCPCLHADTSVSTLSVSVLTAAVSVLSVSVFSAPVSVSVLTTSVFVLCVCLLFHQTVGRHGRVQLHSTMAWHSMSPDARGTS